MPAGFIVLGIVLIYLLFFKTNKNLHVKVVLCEVCIFGLILGYLEVFMVSLHSSVINIICLVFGLALMGLALTFKQVNLNKVCFAVLLSSIVYLSLGLINFQWLIGFNSALGFLIFLSFGLIFCFNVVNLAAYFTCVNVVVNLLDYFILNAKIGFAVLGSLDVLGALSVAFIAAVLFRQLAVLFKNLVLIRKRKNVGDAL